MSEMRLLDIVLLNYYQWFGKGYLYDEKCAIIYDFPQVPILGNCRLASGLGINLACCQ